MEDYFIHRNACPGCNSLNKKRVYALPYSEPLIKDYLTGFYSQQGGIETAYFENATYTLEECLDCSLIFQAEIPNDFLMHKIYEEWLDPEKIYELYEKNNPLEYYYQYANQIYWVLSQFKCQPDKLNFLDFGMGWGNWALMAKAFGCNSYGSELSKDRIIHAKENGIKCISWEEFPNYQFDFINTDQVFEHISNPLETLQYLSESLKSGGLLRISVPNGNHAKELIEKMDWKAPKEAVNSVNIVAPLEHINCFTHESIVSMAKSAGLELVRLPLRPRLFIDHESSIQDDLRELVRRSVLIIKKSLKMITGKQIPKETYNLNNTNLYFRK